VRWVEAGAKRVYWSESGELVAIVGEDTFYILRYDPESLTAGGEEGPDGVEDAFALVGLCHFLIVNEC